MIFRGDGGGAGDTSPSLQVFIDVDNGYCKFMLPISDHAAADAVPSEYCLLMLALYTPFLP